MQLMNRNKKSTLSAKSTGEKIVVKNYYIKTSMASSIASSKVNLLSKY